jgi:ATP-dependent DNA helicase RecG
MRGPGEFFGIRQHGLPEFRIANPVADQDILVRAREWAKRLYGEYTRNSEKARFLLNHVAMFSNLRVDLIEVA